MDAQDVINKLKLNPLPGEGGYFRETYRSPGLIPETVLPHLGGKRSYSTCIYYLITPSSFSTIHRVKSDEVWHFLGGDVAEMVQVDEKGSVKWITLGSLDNSEEEDVHPQIVVPAGIWQATKLRTKGQWALFSCTVAPGFDFADFEPGDFSKISKILTPENKTLLKQYVHS